MQPPALARFSLPRGKEFGRTGDQGQTERDGVAKQAVENVAEEGKTRQKQARKRSLLV